MPSTILGFYASGQQLVSGNPWSGRPTPFGTIQLFNDPASSGPAYVAYSGGVTITSGGALSSGGMLDGMPIFPGAARQIDRLCLVSGVVNVFCTVTPAVSGRVRLYWEAQ